jgi:hypothetical protein
VEEFLDLKNLTRRIPFSKTVIEEWIADGVLIRGVHYSQPSGSKGKRVFWWSAIEKWIKGQDFDLRARHAAKNQERDTTHRLSVSR